MTDGLRHCKECRAHYSHWGTHDFLAAKPLYGPRKIRAADIDRAIDDDGKRVLFIEEKAEGEKVSPAQHRLLIALANLPNVTVWGCRGDAGCLTVTELPSGRVIVSNGDWAAYQAAVDAWFTEKPMGGAAPSNTPAILEDIADIEWRRNAGADVEAEVSALIRRLEQVVAVGH